MYPSGDPAVSMQQGAYGGQYATVPMPPVTNAVVPVTSSNRYSSTGTKPKRTQTQQIPPAYTTTAPMADPFNPYGSMYLPQQPYAQQPYPQPYGYPYPQPYPYPYPYPYPMPGQPRAQMFLQPQVTPTPIVTPTPTPTPRWTQPQTSSMQSSR